MPFISGVLEILADHGEHDCLKFMPTCDISYIDFYIAWVCRAYKI